MKTTRALTVASSLLLASMVASFATAPLIVAAQAPSDDRATSFHAVSSGAHEDVPGGDLLVAAYAVVLVALIAYVAYIGAMQQGTQREMARLEKLVSARAKAEDEGSLPAKKV